MTIFVKNGASVPSALPTGPMGDGGVRARGRRGKEQARPAAGLVEEGEEITITRHGKEVARLVDGAVDRRPGGSQRGASAHSRARRTGKLGRFDWTEWKSYRGEGRSPSWWPMMAPSELSPNLMTEGIPARSPRPARRRSAGPVGRRIGDPRRRISARQGD